MIPDNEPKETRLRTKEYEPVTETFFNAVSSGTLEFLGQSSERHYFEKNLPSKIDVRRVKFIT